jgi:immunity protein 35 of polymorphic toxin system
MTTTPPGPEKGPITRERAFEIGREAIAKLKPGTEFLVLEEKVQDKDWGWVFFYGTRQFVETGDPRFVIAGTGPFVIERADGALQFLSTSVPPSRAIAEYERRRAEAPQKA